MGFNDISKYYRELYPEVTPVSSQVVETPTGAKDISNEVKEVQVDNTWTGKDEKKEDTPKEPEPQKGVEDERSSTDN